MPNNTKDYLSISTEWTEVFAGPGDAYMTVENRSSPIMWRVAESRPSVEVSTGHTLNALHPPQTFVGVKQGQKIYVRSKNGASAICLS